MSEPVTVSPRILLVGADPAMQLLLQQALAEMGYASTRASSLGQALRLLHQQAFDLVVTDTFSRTGQEVLSPLRPLLALSHPLPVILCTAWPLAETDVRNEGFAGLVPQPFELDQLVTMVAACLNQPWSPAQLRQAEVVNRYVESFHKQDIEAVLALFTEEVLFLPWMVPTYPFARPVRGKAAARVSLQEMWRYLGAFQMEGVHLYRCPHGVAARLLVRWHDPSGAQQQQIMEQCVKVTSEELISQSGLLPPDVRLEAQPDLLRDTPPEGDFAPQA
jgi:CheY-like chemotaxis protein